MPTTEPRVLLLGGVDPSGGAGLSLDAIVVAAHGGHALPVPIVLTAQNRSGFRAAFPVPEGQWRAALAAALEDGEIAAVKVGLLGGPAAVRAVAAALRGVAGAPIVVDPVLSATAGGFAGGEDLVAAYRERLLPLADLVTPNLGEYAALFGGGGHSGVGAVLQKGGHGEGPEVEDVLFAAAAEHRFRRRRLAVGEVRGTGCALAAAIAAKLASGVGLVRACREAGDWLHARLVRLGAPRADGLPHVLTVG